jgi:predicted ArsR family transcriptional regulator
VRDDVPVSDALAATANELGRALGEAARSRATGPLDDKALMRIARDVMSDYGYEPRDDDSCLTLANCPFHALAQNYTELVCGMNLDLLRGLLEGLQATHLQAQLDPAPNRCCVTICEK